MTKKKLKTRTDATGTHALYAEGDYFGVTMTKQGEAMPSRVQLYKNKADAEEAYKKGLENV